MNDPTVERDDTTRFVVELGTGLLVAGESVDEVQRRLRAVARAARRADLDAVVFPTVLFVQSETGRGRQVELGSVARSGLRLDQISELYLLSDAAEHGEIAARDGLGHLAAIRARSAPLGPVARTLGLGVLSSGFALLLQPTPVGVLGAFVLGVLVGLLQLIRVPALQAVMPVLASFGVAAAVFAVAESYDGENPIRSLIPPLVIFLPGAAITTGMMELAVGQMISGASRLVEGLADLGLLAFGIVSAAALVGTPPTSLVDRPLDQLGAWSPIVAIVVIAAGLHLHMCAPLRAVPWIVLVLGVALGGQALGAALFSAELSGFFGAFAMTPLVLWAGRSRQAPPAMVLFLPGFWLLVPGAAGLIGITQMVGSGSRLGPADFTATMVTVLAISLGVLLGTAVARAGDQMRRRARRARRRLLVRGPSVPQNDQTSGM